MWAAGPGGCCTSHYSPLSGLRRRRRRHRLLPTLPPTPAPRRRPTALQGTSSLRRHRRRLPAAE
uniref:Uncharacterized protein n=1 Tax=Arundo donax TaxID=35708 RepID=A0A0A9DFR3_ARUDO